MAFDFRNIIGKIKDQFKPKTYFNVDTGEVIKRRIYNKLDEKEKSTYIPTVKFDDIKPKLPKEEIKQTSHNKTRIPNTFNTTSNTSIETKGTRVPFSRYISNREEREEERRIRKLRKVELKQREREERQRARKEQAEKTRLAREQKQFEDRNKSRQQKEQERWYKRKEKEQTKADIKRQKAIDKQKQKAQKRWEEEQEKWKKRKEKEAQKEIEKAKTEPKKKGRPKGSKNKPKEKTYEDVKPEAPPKKITKDIEKRSAETTTIGDIDTLKKRLLDLQRKEYPLLDLSNLGEYLYNMVENNEAYYEQEDGTNTYDDYLIQNMEDIDEAIKSVEYYGSTQEEIGGFITHLTNKLNMGALSISEAEDVASIIEQGFLVNGEFNSF